MLDSCGQPFQSHILFSLSLCCVSLAVSDVSQVFWTLDVCELWICSTRHMTMGSAEMGLFAGSSSLLLIDWIVPLGFHSSFF